MESRPLCRLQYLVIAICFALNMLDGMDVLAISYAAPLIMDEWQIAASRFGLVFSAALVGMAMGAMLMNMSSNMMGLGNAATPFGLKAMKELARLNPHPGAASNAMVLFVAINTSAITLMAPSGTMMVRAAAGSDSPGAIWIPTLIATTCSTTAAIAAYYLLRGRKQFAARPLEEAEGADASDVPELELPEGVDPHAHLERLG